MEQQKIDMFLAQNGDKLPKEKIMVMQDALTALDDSKSIFVQSIKFKDPTTVLIISILFKYFFHYSLPFCYVFILTILILCTSIPNNA